VVAQVQGSQPELYNILHTFSLYYVHVVASLNYFFSSHCTPLRALDFLSFLLLHVIKCQSLKIIRSSKFGISDRLTVLRLFYLPESLAEMRTAEQS
jgi:hypothetical protein